MRNIGFRAWDGSKMHYRIGISASDTLEEAFGLIASGGWLLQQATDLEDRNGKKIYEGDIIKDSTTNSVWVVTWNAEAGGWTDKDDNPYNYGLYKSLEKSLEVIGNICENPDLVQGEL